MLAAVDFGKLFELVWAAVIAGIATSTLFATLIVGATRATDRRREGRHAAATAALVLAAGAALACLAGIVFGIAVIVSK
jgi:hypothetical protein